MSSITSVYPHNFDNLKCPTSTLICREKTTILGDVTIGPDCVIHPTVQIIARNGPILIGSSNLIEERVSIINEKSHPMTIGNHNVFEVGAQCHSTNIGNNNVLESKSSIDSSIELSDYCVVGAGCSLASSTKTDDQRKNILSDKLDPYTVISGFNLDRRVVTNLPPSSHNSQLDFLRKILPNYQKLWRPTNLPATPQLK